MKKGRGEREREREKSGVRRGIIFLEILHNTLDLTNCIPLEINTKYKCTQAVFKTLPIHACMYIGNMRPWSP